MLTAANHLLQLTEQVDTKIKSKQLTAKGLVLDCLKEAYFRRLKAEKLDSTPRLTEELDILQLAIKDFQKSFTNEKSTN